MNLFWSVIVNATLLSAALAFVVWCMLSIVPRSILNAATRHVIWCTMLTVTLGMPFSHLEFPARPTPVANTTNQAPPVAMAISKDLPDAAPVTVPIAASPVHRPLLPVEIPASPWLRPLLITWIACGLLLLLRVVVSYVALYRRGQRAADASPDLCLRMDAWLSQRADATRRIRLAVSGEVKIPVATGPLQPTILIPMELMDTLSPEDLDQIVRHEAAHLIRWDDKVLLFQRIMEALFASHPVVRFVTRQIDLEREIACDDMVAQSTETARSYADCLTRTVALCGGVRGSLAGASVADSRSHLSKRVMLLLSGKRDARTGVLKVRGMMIAVVLVCLGGQLANTPLFVAFAGPIALQPVTPPVPAKVAPARPPVLIAQRETPKATAPPAPAESTPAPMVAHHGGLLLPPPAPRYILGANDVLGITVISDPRLSGSYSIDPDGYLTMPLIGEIKAAGMPIPDLRAIITTVLADKTGQPTDTQTVGVQLLRNNSKKFTLVGAISKPGPYPLIQQTTVLDALAASEFKPHAVSQKIYVLRGATKIPFNYKEVIEGKRVEQNITLQDGDIIVVPDAGEMQ